MVEWTWSGVEACLFWSCTDVIVVRVKVSRGFEPFSPWGSTVRTLVNRPMGRFAWTNHIYFQITQPGCSTVTPLYRPIEAVKVKFPIWMRSSRLLVRASDSKCRSRNNCLGFDPSILRHSGIWGAADEAVLNIVHWKKKSIKIPFKKLAISFGSGSGSKKQSFGYREQA